MSRERLHKVMAACGVGSRRACEAMILQGRVDVNGQTVSTLGTLVDPAEDLIRCDGERLRPSRPLYFLLNKPRGVICTASGAPGLPRAIDYAPPSAREARLFTIGRLDVDSEGAIILTNDGELTHVISHPRFEVEKTYRVEVSGTPDEATLERMRKGVWLAEGRTGPIKIELSRSGRQRSVLIVVLREGRKREVRRLCARFGHEVLRLVRTAIGPIELGRLPAGETRPLSPKEIASLKTSANVVIRLGTSPKALRFRKLRPRR